MSEPVAEVETTTEPVVDAAPQDAAPVAPATTPALAPGYNYDTGEFVR